jgi:hypothetical protein
MFSILIYLSLPFAFLFHSIEETAKRRRWARLNADRISHMHPSMRPLLVHLRDMTGAHFCTIVAEELLFITLAATSAICGPYMAPLFALTWAFCIHLLAHAAMSLATKGYVPGIITTVLLLPYAGIAVADMLQQFPWQDNLLYAVSGTTATMLNTIVTHSIFRK